MVAHAFNPSTWEAEAGGFLSSRPALVYKVSSRTARAIQRNPVSKNKQIKKYWWHYRGLIWFGLGFFVVLFCFLGFCFVLFLRQGFSV